MCIVKANLACGSLKIVPWLLEQHVSELKTTTHCCEHCCHHALRAHLAFTRKKYYRNKRW